MKNILMVVCILLFSILIAVSINDILHEIMTTSLCRTFGWSSGDYALMDGGICIYSVECPIEEVVAETCNIPKGER